MTAAMYQSATLREQAVRRYFRALLADARAGALADAEAAEGVIFAIEALGRHLSRRAESLEVTGPALVDYVKVENPAVGDRFRRMLELMRYGRNDRMHKGFAARNLARDAIRVSLVLEETMRVKWPEMTAGDVMTGFPVVVACWMSFSQVRDLLIENAYSQVPIKLGDVWYVITERKLAGLVQAVRRKGASVDLRVMLLSDRIPECLGLGSGSIAEALTEPAVMATQSTPVVELCVSSGCVLVYGEGAEKELAGIITPMDIA